jgi:hypothetical protein
MSLKDDLKLNTPRRTPGHATKSHVVKTNVDGKPKMIRFGEQGASTAGKPSPNDSAATKAKRKAFKDRHAKNIAKGPASAAYWSNRVKWAKGGPVEDQRPANLRQIMTDVGADTLSGMLGPIASSAYSLGNQYFTDKSIEELEADKADVDKALNYNPRTKEAQAVNEYAMGKMSEGVVALAEKYNENKDSLGYIPDMVDYGMEQYNELDPETRFAIENSLTVGELIPIGKLAGMAKGAVRNAGDRRMISDAASDVPDESSYLPLQDRLEAMGAKQNMVGLDEGLEAMADRQLLDEANVTAPPVLAVPLENAKGHAMPPLLLVSGTGVKPTMPIVQTFTPKNTPAVMASIDSVLANNPLSLASEKNWLDTEAQAFGGDFLPAPPSQAIKYTQNPQALANKLQELSPEMKAAVDEGFGYVNEIKDIYNTGQSSEDMTARLFTWGILSRGAGPMQQEGAFLDILEGATPFISKAIDGNFTEADLPAWKEMVAASLPEGSPGKQVTMNANAAGSLLMQLGKVSEGTGTTALKQLHDLLADPNASGPQVRRKFFELTNKAGIDNKVVSFLSLVGGKDDLLVMDRIQSRHLWDDGRYEGKNIYDGIDKGGLTNIIAGPRGLMITEMLENGLADTVTEAYRLLGRPEDASLGRMHWESWLIEGNQPVSHSTLQSVRSGNTMGAAVTEGKPGTFSSGATYRQTINGSIQEYPLSDGGIVRMTPERQKEFEQFIKNPKNGIVPKGFKVTASREGPWFTDAKINRSKLDEAARQFENANVDGSLQSGAVRSISGSNTISGRRAEFLGSFRSDQARAIAAGRDARTDSGRNSRSQSGPYRGGSTGGNGGDGLLVFEADPSALTQYQSAGLSLPTISQVDSPSNAVIYNSDMTAAMAENKFSPQVEIKSAEDLAQANLFRTSDGSGFAIKPDGDVVAVFASPSEPKGGSYAMLQAAVQAGGKKLDAFDTFLPGIYERVGFRPVARLPWNEDYAPAGWDKEVFKKYNNGEPDVVFFAHDPDYYGGAKDVPIVKDYDQAVALQDDALAGMAIYQEELRLIEGGYPDSTARDISTGLLPMDNASRMARAAEQGYNLDDITTRWLSADRAENLIRQDSRYKFGDGIYSGHSPAYGQSYTNPERSPVAYPMAARGKIAGKGDALAAEKALISSGNMPQDYTQRMNAINVQLKADGFTGLDYAGERVMFDENTSRAALGAAFDPRQKTSSKVLAGVGAGAVGLGVMSGGEDNSFAKGGIVNAKYDADKINKIAQGIMAENFAEGGPVVYNASRINEIANRILEEL